MERASTTLKMTPTEHRELVALLQFHAKLITEEQFRAVLAMTGRDPFKGVETHRLVEILSESLAKIIR